MPLWVVKVCDPEGHREKDELYGIFDTMPHASEWARENVPTHITWNAHHLMVTPMFDRQDWERRIPEFLKIDLRSKRGT